MDEAPRHRGTQKSSTFVSLPLNFLVAAADEVSFQLSVAYPRGGDKLTLRASSPRERHNWMTDIEMASLKCREAEKAAALKARR